MQLRLYAAARRQVRVICRRHSARQAREGRPKVRGRADPKSAGGPTQSPREGRPKVRVPRDLLVLPRHGRGRGSPAGESLFLLLTHTSRAGQGPRRPSAMCVRSKKRDGPASLESHCPRGHVTPAGESLFLLLTHMSRAGQGPRWPSAMCVRSKKRVSPALRHRHRVGAVQAERGKGTTSHTCRAPGLCAAQHDRALSCERLLARCVRRVRPASAAPRPLKP